MVFRAVEMAVWQRQENCDVIFIQIAAVNFTALTTSIFWSRTL